MTEKAEMGRRSFLILVAGAISALTLPYDKLIALETRQSAVKFRESGSEKDRKMNNKILAQVPTEWVNVNCF